MTSALEIARGFRAQVAWNGFGFVVFAASGAVLSAYLLIAIDAAALGVFNQLYAAFVIVGQVAAFGVHDSVQRHLAANGGAGIRGLVWSGLIVSGLGGLLIAVAFYLLAPFTANLFDSEHVTRGMSWLAPGFFAFAINKSLLGALNGHRRIREYALAQSARGISILTIGVTVGAVGLPLEWLALCFTVTEYLLLPFLLTACRADLRAGFPRTRAEARWIRRHLSFGIRGMPNGLLAEAFVRSDILVLGAFLSDGLVGIYSLAALFIEGLYQISVVIRVVVNPMLARHLAQLNRRPVLLQLGKVAGLSLVLVGAAGVVVLIGFPYFSLVIDPVMVMEAGRVYGILLIGIVVYSVTAPFEGILLQSGRPGTQSLMLASVVLLNILLNVVLIPRFELYGAAIATMISFISASVLVLSSIWFVTRLSRTAVKN